MERDKFIEDLRVKMLSDITAITEDRGSTYGPAYDSFTRIGVMWEAYYKSKYGIEIKCSSVDVGFMLSLFKMCREFNKHNSDNGTDGSNYFAFAVAFSAWEEMQKKEENKTQYAQGGFVVDPGIRIANAFEFDSYITKKLANELDKEREKYVGGNVR